MSRTNSLFFFFFPLPIRERHLQHNILHFLEGFRACVPFGLCAWCVLLNVDLALCGSACFLSLRPSGLLFHVHVQALRLRGGAGRSTRSIKKQQDRGLQNKMKRQGKGHVAGSGGNGAGHGKHKTQTGGGELGGRGSLLLGDPGVRRNGGLSKGEVKRPNASVLQEKHRPSAIPAAAWDLLGGGIEQTRQAIWQAANEETGASLQDNHAAVGFTGRGEQARPPLQAAVSYLPPPRARPEVGSTTAADFGSEGDRGRDSHWAWRTTKAEKDSSQRAFTADLNRILAQADVLLEVLDARDPDGCRTRKVEEHVHATRPELKIVLVLNKIDLVPPHVTAAWVRHLKADYPVVLFKASTRVHNGKVLAHARTRPDTATDKQLSTGDCVGAEQLLQVLKAMSRTDAGFGGKAKISVGVVGQPNVGKSSLINSLLRHKATCTGDRPGVTKHLQALQLDKGITLLDSPGVVVESGADAVTSEAVLALRNCGTQFTCLLVQKYKH